MIKPNRGTIFAVQDLAAEVQILRRSLTTHKVTEQIESLQWSATASGLLEPLQKISSKTLSNDSEGKVDQEMTTNAASTAAAVVIPAASGPSRLITFDATDPEFDEDDDPDADLDL